MNLGKFLIAAIITTATGLGYPFAHAAPDTDGEWRKVDPGVASFDADKLADLVGDIRHGRLLNGLHSLIIVRGGDIVVEEYFDGWQVNQIHMLQSVSKSVTSTLVGIAIDRGDLAGVNENILDFFPDYKNIRYLDDRKRAIKLQDLLTMRSGTDYNEDGGRSPHGKLNSLSRGWDRFYLDRPMESAPGTRFLYDSGAVILSSALLNRRTGMHADGYAAKYLFSKLGISDTRWISNAEGHPHTGGGLYLTPRDMAKFGLLYLRNGRWKGEQVVPQTWVEQSTAQHVTFEKRRWYGHGTGYGYWWWIFEPDPAGLEKVPIYAALGIRGQHIFVVPEHDLVVVTTAGMHSGMHKPIDVLYTHILPAIIDKNKRFGGIETDFQ